MSVARILCVLASMCLIAGCRLNRAESVPSVRLRQIGSPVVNGSFSPRVSSQSDGSVILSWLEPKGDTVAALRFSVWRNGAWSEPITITPPQPFSRHPSESPGVIALSKTNLIAYWSQKPPTEQTNSHEVDVYFAVSTDGGEHWTTPTLANVPGTGEESSYPSAAPVDTKHAALISLDGTDWSKKKRIALMSRFVQSDGSATEATVIDPDTCTCCPTSLVRTGSGLLAAYRGHTPENIRDISLLRNVDGRWSQPHIPHPDHWHFAGCPVNGPTLANNGTTTALAWFSAPQDQAYVKAAFSDNSGSEFGPPIRIDEGDATGRAQIVALPGPSALVFWIATKSGAMRFLGRRVHANGTLEPLFEIARGTDLGYPHAAPAHDGIVVTWAEGSPVQQVYVALIQSSSTKAEQ